MPENPHFVGSQVFYISQYYKTVDSGTVDISAFGTNAFVFNTCVRVKAEVEKPPKSESSHRTLPLMALVKAYLERLKENKMPHIRFHDIRHFTASYLNKLGFTPKEIQVWLGHADIKTTMNIYTHIDTGMKENIAARVDGMFGDF